MTTRSRGRCGRKGSARGRQRILPKHLLNLQRQAGKPFAEIRVPPPPTKPERPTGSGSSPLQNIEDPGQGSGVDASTADYAPHAAQHDLDPIVTRLGTAPDLRRYDRGRLARSQPAQSPALVPLQIALGAVCDAKREVRRGRYHCGAPSRRRGAGRPGSPKRSWPSRPQTSAGDDLSRRPQAARRHRAYDCPYALFSARRTPRRKAALTGCSPLTPLHLPYARFSACADHYIARRNARWSAVVRSLPARCPSSVGVTLRPAESI
jgi:hypothetical protein